VTYRFDDAVVTGVLRHMNGDHTDDNLLIVRAFGPRGDVVGASMTGFDGEAGEWVADLPDGSSLQVSVAWPGGPISERPQVRREIVALYDEACRMLGVEPRPHS
jgi:Protein of unknown function (DUF2470)